MNEIQNPAYKLAASRMFLTQGDVRDLEQIANSIPEDGAVVDLGAGSGTTALAVWWHRPNASMLTVDISRENLDWSKRNVEAYMDVSLMDWTFQQSTALEAATTDGVVNTFVDLLLHDASHDEGIVYADLCAWWRWVNIGGYIWVHDAYPMPGAPETYPGVSEAINRFTTEHRRQLAPIPDLAGIGWAARRIR